MRKKSNYAAEFKARVVIDSMRGLKAMLSYVAITRYL